MSQTPNRGACQGCGKSILWIKTPAGKFSPYDAKPTSVLFTEGQHGYPPAGGGPGLETRQIGNAHLSHFITCPDRDRFRRAKREPKA
jgi:hypothetical protein